MRHEVSGWKKSDTMLEPMESIVEPQTQNMLSEAASDPYGEPPVNRRLSFSAADPPKPMGAEQGVVPVGKGAKAVVEALSEDALRKRVERLMKPKVDGTYKVPEELRKAWRSGDQKQLIQEFKSAGLDKDRGISFFQFHRILTTLAHEGDHFCNHPASISRMHLLQSLAKGSMKQLQRRTCGWMVGSIRRPR